MKQTWPRLLFNRRTDARGEFSKVNFLRAREGAELRTNTEKTTPVVPTSTRPVRPIISTTATVGREKFWPMCNF